MKKEKAKKIAFLDRDGVINKCAPEHQYITKPEDFIFNPGVFSVLNKLKKDGFEFIVITNQRGISRKLLTEKSLSEIHSFMITALKVQGIEILDIFFCPHAIDSCNCRKPKPGLLKRAINEYKIDIAESIIISDSEDDIEMGKKFGLGQQILIPENNVSKVLSSYKKPKIRVAFIKYGGMSAGGTEKMLQIIASNLDKNKFAVDFYFCDPSIFIGSDYTYPSTDINRLNYVKSSGVNLIKFTVGAVNLVNPFHKWVDTNFWEVFDETKYDLIQIGRAGHKEYPFNKINRTPIIDTIALTAGADNQYNIARVLHLCNWSADRWVKSGGDKSRSKIISLPIAIEDKDYGNFRTELELTDKFIFGMHQRNSDAIFSNLPLESYKMIENEQTAFIILGGSTLYKNQADKLGLKNIVFLPETGDSKIIFKFLSTLNVYAHGRKDGEVNSQAMAEAMFFGLPIVSHFSNINNGHVECIGNAGKVVATMSEYKAELEKLYQNKEYYLYVSKNSKQRFREKYELKKQIKHLEDIYQSVLEDPFPNPIRRILTSLHWTQNVRIVMKWVYRKVRYWYGIKI